MKPSNRAYDLPADEDSEFFFDKPIREAEGILSAVSEMRCGGFFHGTGDAGFVIEESRAKLCQNVAKAIGECLLDLGKPSP